MCLCVRLRLRSPGSPIFSRDLIFEPCDASLTCLPTCYSLIHAQHADHEQFAHTALKTKLLKDKLLAQNEEVQSAVADKLSANLIAPQEAGSSAAKVYGRLLSSKTLAEAVHAVVDTLREVLDPSLAKEKTKGKSESQSQEVESRSEEDEEDVEVRPAKGKRPRLVEDGGQSGSEDDDIDDAGWESGTVDGGDGAGWESGTVDGDDAQVAHFSDDESSSTEEESDEEASADTGDSDALPSDGPQVKTKPKPKPKPPATDSKGKAKTSGAESTFLPSLSVGFTRGDSDASDFSDGEADAPRKNRRGQRARRAYVPQFLLLPLRLVACSPFHQYSSSSPHALFLMQYLSILSFIPFFIAYTASRAPAPDEMQPACIIALKWPNNGGDIMP